MAKDGQIRVNPEDKERFLSLMKKSEAALQRDFFSMLLDGYEKEEGKEAKSINEITSTIQWFTSQIDELNAQLEAVARERDELREKVQAAAPQAQTEGTSPAHTQSTRTAPPRVSGGSLSKVDAVIDALLAWNTAQSDPQQQIRISVPIIKALGSLIGATYQPAIQEAMRLRASEIDEIHARFLIGSRHNRSIDKDAVLQAVARDYMGVSNWQEVKF